VPERTSTGESGCCTHPFLHAAHSLDHPTTARGAAEEYSMLSAQDGDA
jgi:hypothetical protein